jgi:ribosomal protein S18 acetylase RimI-like enzyme
MCNSGDIAVSVESELPAFAMVMLYRGGEIAVCGPGHGEDCLKEAERLAAGYLIEVVNAWVRDDNKRAKKLFKTHGYKVIGYSQRNNVPGVRYAKALR